MFYGNKLFIAFIAALSLTVFHAQYATAAEAKYDIMFDGHNIGDDEVVRLGENKSGGVGDVVLLDNEIALSLERPGKYRFVTAEPDNGVIYLIDAKGKKKPVAAIVSRDYPDPEASDYEEKSDDEYNKEPIGEDSEDFEDSEGAGEPDESEDESEAGPKLILNNPLEKLTDEELRGLRGIRLEYWDEKVAARMKKVIAERTCITIAEDTKQGERDVFPPLPEKTGCLRVQESSSDGIKDYSYLIKFSKLKYISFEVISDATVDILLLGNNKDLRFFSGQFVNNFVDFSALGGFKKLRVLDVSYVSNIKDVAFAAALKELRRLDVSMTKISDISPLKQAAALEHLDIGQTSVKDLSPLSGLKKLVSINADNTEVAALPSGGFPALRELRLFSTPATDKVAAGFAKAHPKAKVFYGWKRMLIDALAGADRLVVRNIEGCSPEGAALVEIKNAEEIKKLLSLIDIDEKNSGGYDACCGWPLLEFYKGKKLIYSISHHHGYALRWEQWPGDAALTPAGADALVGWFSAHGIDGPAKELKEQRAAADEVEKKYNRIIAVIPKEVLESLKKREGPYLDAFEKGIPDELERVKVYIRILGANDKAWDLSDDFMMGIERTLKEDVSAEILVEAIKGLAEDPQGLNGAGALLFFHNKMLNLDKISLSWILPMVARHAISQPVVSNRKRTLDDLAYMDNDVSNELLRKVMNGEIKPPPAKDDYYEEGDRWIPLSSVEEGVEYDTDSAYAAYLLAMNGDSKSFEKIRAMATSARGNDKIVLDDAVSLISGK